MLTLLYNSMQCTLLLFDARLSARPRFSRNLNRRPFLPGRDTKLPSTSIFAHITNISSGWESE
jgi:hypothetical protein